MSNRRFYIVLMLTIVSSMLVRTSHVSGSYEVALFSDNATHLSTLFLLICKQIWGFLNSVYLSAIVEIGYFNALFITLILFRFVFYPIDIIVLFNESKSDSASNERPKIGRLIVILLPLVTKITLTIILFSIINRHIIHEPTLWGQSRFLFNALIGLILIPAYFMSTFRRQFSPIKRNSTMLLNIILYGLGCMYLSVSILIFIVTMQICNGSANTLFVLFQRSFVKGNVHEKSFQTQ